MANSFKWKTIIGLILIYIAVIMYPAYQWLWGVLFLYWTLPSLFSGSTYFIEPVHRSENPILYWIIVITWLALSVYILVEAFL